MLSEILSSFQFSYSLKKDRERTPHLPLTKSFSLLLHILCVSVLGKRCLSLRPKPTCNPANFCRRNQSQFNIPDLILYSSQIQFSLRARAIPHYLVALSLTYIPNNSKMLPYPNLLSLAIMIPCITSP